MNTSFIKSDLLSALELSPLPVEGGFFRRTCYAPLSDKKNSYSCIYYAMTQNQHSDWHQLQSDEIWFYHSGPSADQLLLFPDGSFEKRRIGPDIAHGELPQSHVPAGVWQATVPVPTETETPSLFSTVCIPAFELKDCIFGKGVELVVLYPDACEMMERLALI